MTHRVIVELISVKLYREENNKNPVKPFIVVVFIGHVRFYEESVKTCLVSVDRFIGAFRFC
jgi:hypothetical protein